MVPAMPRPRRAFDARRGRPYAPRPTHPTRSRGVIVADPSPARGRWAFRPVPPEPRSIVELIRGGTLDSELAATLWLLVEGRVPLLVAGEGQGTGKTTLLGALLDFVPPGTRMVELAGASETFDWLPQASELGWPGAARPAPGGAIVKP